VITVKDVYKAVHEARPQAGFGISPVALLSNLRSDKSYFVDIDKWMASNEYIDYDSIIFFGEWFNNTSHAERLSEVLNVKITAKDLVKSEIIQAIFRTQARREKPISIAFFYNYKGELINGYDSFEEGIYEILELKNNHFKNMILIRRIKNELEKNVNKNTYKKVISFIKYLNLDKITDNKKTIEISLKELSSIVDYKFPSKRSTKPLSNALLTYYNIELIL